MPRLLERVMQRRRDEEDQAVEDQAAAPASQTPAPESDAARIAALEVRLRHLESELEGLQDSVHREAVRRGKEIDALDKKTEADEIARALDRHARDRGL